MKAKKRIILVDSNEQTLSERTFLLRNKGFRVTPCNTANQALETILNYEDSVLDVLVSEMQLSDFDGNKLCSAVRMIRPFLTLILLIEDGQEEVYDLVADGFIPKCSYSSRVLLDRINLLSVRKRGPRPNYVKGATDDKGKVSGVFTCVA